MRRDRALRLTTLALCVLAGCGDSQGDDGTPGPLSSGERARVDEAQRSIRSYCRDVGRFRAGAGHPPARAKAQAARQAVSDLIAGAREKPGAAYGPSQTMRQLLGDTAEDLEGTSCSAVLVDTIERALATLPPP